MLNCRKLFIYLYLGCLYLGVTASGYGSEANTMIVSYVTAHLNQHPDAVKGVVVTPSGVYYKTEPMGAFSHQKIVIYDPEEGGYSAYFESLIDIPPKYCPIVGGIDVNLCNKPAEVILFIPKESRVQGFTQKIPVKKGDTTLPVASFCISAP